MNLNFPSMFMIFNSIIGGKFLKKIFYFDATILPASTWQEPPKFCGTHASR